MSSGLMAKTKLNLPSFPPEFLELNYVPSDSLDVKELEIHNGSPHPFAVGSPFLATIVNAQQLTFGEDVKKVVDICLDIQSSGIEYKPGDTIGVIPQNHKNEVEELLKHLNIIDRADTVVTVSVKPGTLKKNACVPPHIPQKSTLRHIFENCIDIRPVLKKVFLRVLSAHTEDPDEQRRLEELCSKEGSAQYTEHIVQPRTTLLDLFEMFTSCCPPVERLLEHLPRLQARPYSIASSSSNNLHIVYSVVELPKLKGKITKSCYGICTGWLQTLTLPIQTGNNKENSLSERLKKLSLDNKPQNLKIPIYLRKSTGFNLPNDASIPLILIGPGTGIAPFIGFLQHRLVEKQSGSETFFGDIWLFFGCRYEEGDFLYRSELEKFIEEGILTQLFVSFSRDRRKETPRYVQDNIKLHSKQFVEQMLDNKSVIYVCGDAKNMAKDVLDTIVSVISEERGIEEQKARLLVNGLQSQGKYLQDIWL